MIIKSPAKINLTLDALYRRKDNYTELRSLIQTIPFFDLIHIKEIPQDKIIISSNYKNLACDQNNLVWQVAQIIKDRFQIKKGLEIYLDKKIPLGGGLAGGSSNAISVLKFLNNFWNLKLSQRDLIDIGGQIGSDTPFFVFEGLCLMEGRGEKITYLTESLDLNLVLIFPPIFSSTKNILQNIDFDKLDKDLSSKKTDELITYLKDKNNFDFNFLINYIHNDLEQVAFNFFPELLEIKTRLEKLGVQKVMMSGSGSTILGFFEDKISDKFKLKIQNEFFQEKMIFI